MKKFYPFNIHPLKAVFPFWVFPCTFLFSSCSGWEGQNLNREVDSLQFPIGGVSKAKYNLLEQLKRYPSPRYFKGNSLLPLFNWMDPYYMGGNGQPGISRKQVAENAVKIQEELALHWNYGIVIPNILTAFNGIRKSDTAGPAFIHLANQYPQIPLHVITFWLGVRPKDIGYVYPRPMVRITTFDPKYYLTFDFYGHPKTEIKYNFPDSFLRMDGLTQQFYLSRILKCLHRPINLISENGEEPPGAYQLDAIKEDPAMIRMKDSMKIESWEDFMAIRKLQMRNVYSSSFMKELPALENTFLSFYGTEGGPINCFTWDIMKKCMTPIRGGYYSTPDFYPRWPKNWKDWTGPWHGWKWIEMGRKVEIMSGDKLFSPFVTPGWSKDPREDIRPSQWLGLLKCLGVIGAEFYYVGYFNLGAPFNDPSQYAWQAAMASYAQAITSRYEDILRNGNVIYNRGGEPIISVKNNDPNCLVTVRKKNGIKKYVIAAALQPFTNEKGELPDKRIETVEIEGKEITIVARKQGSVYIYDCENEKAPLFYQLDTWHENKHPDHWTSDFYFEAEVPDNVIPDSVVSTIAGKKR